MTQLLWTFAHNFFYDHMFIFIMSINPGLEGWWFSRFYEKMPDHFPKQLCHSTLPSMMCEHSSCPPSLPTYCVVSLNFSHSDGYIVIFHFGVYIYIYVCVCARVLSLCLSLGSHLLGKVSCHILRTLKQFCDEVHLIWNLGILPITSRKVRPHPQWGSILGKKVLQHHQAFRWPQSSPPSWL